MINGYGPTESTFFATYYVVNEINEEAETIPIGKPLANTQIYILDKDDQLCSIGVVGELCIAGDGLARGYLNRAKLTEEKFVSKVFANEESLEVRLYRTGDLAKWLPDGNIKYIGRVDTQVKIRGFRIELGEIENRLLANESILEAVVIDRTDSIGSKYLAAYYVATSESACAHERSLELRNYLSKELPEYMIPLHFIQLDKMPLTRNGKVDKRALPEPDISAKVKDYQAPTNEIEERLTMIWAKILGTQKVGITDNFFELGGHSLKATAMVSSVFKEFNVELPIREVFKTPIVKELALYISKADENIYASIEKIEDRDYYSLSSAQKRLYLLNQLEEIKTSYNMPFIMKVKGDLDKGRFDKVIQELIARHDAFRTSFEMIDGEVVQRIYDDVDFEFAYLNIDDKKTEKQIIKEFIRPFDLSQAPLLRVGLIEKEDEALLIFDMHHIISDGMSMQILTNEFIQLYAGRELPKLRIQYIDFASWQNDLFNSEVFNKQEKYWLTKFGQDETYSETVDNDVIPILNMPTDYPRPAVMSFAGETISFALEKEISNKLNNLANDNGATLYMVLLASYNILLSKYSNQEDIIVGSPIAGRPHADLKNIIGMFVNTLAMRNMPYSHLTFREFLNNVKENAIAAYENQDYQFEMLVNKLDLRRDMSRNPIFDTMFVLQNLQMQNIELDSTDQALSDLSFLPYSFENKISKFDITLNAWESNDTIHCNLQYCTRLFKKETMERFSGHFQNIVTQILEDPDRKIMEITMISDIEKEDLIYRFNNTKADYPKHKTIQQIFEEQAQKNPENIALIFNDQKMTYSELNEKSNQLAKVLYINGVKPDKIVGLMVERSFEMIVGILGILKAGGAYLPIDPDNPVARIEYILQDSGTDLLVVHSNQSLLAENIQFNGKIINIEDEAICKQSTDNFKIEANSNNLAYVIYTSGTTGKPKGTLTSHYNIIRVVKNTNYIEITKNDRLLQLSNYAFDGSTFDIYGALLNGAKLVMVPKETLLDVANLSELIREEEITVTFITTALFNMLVDTNIECFARVRKILFGGERISVQHVQKALMHLGKDRLIHVYGPTESTVFATYYFINEVKADVETIPIGNPLANTQVYILDKDNQLAPVGVVGELCISGDGLARGYLNRSKLTAEKFVPNLLIENADRIYRTGDMAKRLADGNIEFVGRIDSQLKIRGFRIELGEIENRLLDHEAISEAVVIDRTDTTGSKYLVAYFITDSECKHETADESDLNLELRSYLSKELPEYMIPLHFIHLDQLPLNRNGKVDRQALPEPNLSTKVKNYVAPTNQFEERLALIWSEILGAKHVGITDNFFELGGHSLKATAMVSRVFKEFNVEIPIREVFKTPTIKELALCISKADENIYSSIKHIVDKDREYYSLSSAQKRIYALNQLEGMNISYNMPSVMKIEGNFNKKYFEDAINKLIKRHDAFRTSFEVIDGEVVQRIHDTVEFKITYLNLADRMAEANKVIKDFIKPFVLSQAPLLRVGLIEFDDERLLIFDMHHIISDGVSMEILINEFIKLYAGIDLLDLKIQYKDFAVWQNDHFNSDKFKFQEKYWIESFDQSKECQNPIPVLNMPTDYPRPSIMNFEGAELFFIVENKVADQLDNLAKENGATLYMTLLAAYNVLLSKYTRQEDIIVGAPIAGRPHPDLHNIIGMFVNTLVMRNMPKADLTFREFLGQVKENALRAYDNQDYQFEMLLDKLDLERDMSRNPLFDTLFTLQTNQFSAETIECDLQFIPYGFERKISKFDLMLVARQTARGIGCNFEYCTKLYNEETIKRLAEHYVNILNQIVEKPDQKLMEIEILSQTKKNQLLYEFNSTKSEYDRDKTIHQLFEEQVVKNPENIALVYENQELTYQELNNKANQLARLLNTKGTNKDQIVSIMMERSIEMVIGVLAVLKAGGAYLPIDAGYPNARIEYILEDSNTKILLTQEKCLKEFGFTGEAILLEELDLSGYEEENLVVSTNPVDRAYVIYTSGSTGQPKGVMIEHRGLVNYVSWARKVYLQGEILDFPLYSSPAFDLTVTSIYIPLLSGSKIVIYGNEDHELLISKIVQDNKVQIIKLTPAHLQILKNLDIKDSNLKRMIVGGEELKRDLAAEIYEKFNGNIEIYNEYGPTETVVGCMIYKFDYEKDHGVSVPIGKPADNVQIYLLDERLKPVATGIEGEIFISGDGVARGYLNKAELTNERFVQNPFISEKRMYKTGDLARRLYTGDIEFLGRIYSQVKVRGFRIELGEIENKLVSSEAIREAVVIDLEDDIKEKYLAAYFVADVELSSEELREYLATELPEYMIPAYFVQLDSLPLTINGKIDRKSLPDPISIREQCEYDAPKTDLQEKLAKIWGEVLNREQIGITDSFFEMGGHSLNAIMISSRVSQELNIELPLMIIFENPTIKQLAEFIGGSEENIYSSIQKIEEREFYPLSSAQKRLYILNQFEGMKTGYNMPVVMKIEGEFNKERIEDIIKKLVKRHDSFRTSFEVIDGEVVQRIFEDVDLEIAYLKVSGKKSEIENVIRQLVKPFDLSNAPLLRIGLVETPNEELLFFDMHHIISDGVSMDNLIKEFVKLYKGIELPELRIQYKDFAVWQNELFNSDKIKKQEEYWLERFDNQNLIPVLNLPTDYARPLVMSFKGKSVHFEVGRKISNQLNNLARENGVTLYMILLAAYNVLLSKYTGQEDIIVGSPIAGRPHSDLEDIIGMFVNTLALRNMPEADITFSEFLIEVKENALKAYENQDYQFEMLVDKLELQRDMSRNPLFDTMFSLQTVSYVDASKQDNVKFSPYGFGNTISKFDLSLHTREINGAIYGTLEFCTKLFKKETLERLAGHYKNILSEIVADPEKRLKEIVMISNTEKEELVYGFNETKRDYRQSLTIHQLFEEQVYKTPEQIALIFKDQKISYADLNQRANQLGGVLIKKGIKPDAIVGLMVERSIEMIIGILGILKAGGAYLPIDPDNPIARTEYILKDSQTGILIAGSSLVESISFDGEVIDINDSEITTQSKDDHMTAVKSSNLAYVMYTSGTTGNPKGNLTMHYNVVRVVKNTNYIEITKEDRLLQLSNYAFDGSTFDIYGALLNGSSLFMVPKGLLLDRSELSRLIVEHGITVTFITTALFNMLVDADIKSLKGIRKILFGGERVSVQHAQRALKYLGKDRLIHVYGPTESTVFATYYFINEIKEDVETIPIGQPLANTQVYILDKDDQVAPIGVVGELCIAGDGLARGYLNQLELTTQKFVKNIFSNGEDSLEARLYRTGDLARRLSDGNIEFVGRIDNQVKIRGFRIELGEIEKRLLEHEAILEAIVVDIKDETDSKYLVGYYVADEDLNGSTLRDYLAKDLPEYMIPVYFIQVDSMPLNKNGKVDRHALPKPEHARDHLKDYVAPTTQTEERLAAVWSEILRIEKVGITDNFFELGGHSLKATTMVSQVYKEFGVELPIREIFKTPTIKALARYIDKADKEIFKSIVSIEERDYYPVSSAQQRMYLLNQLGEMNTGYNMPTIMSIEGDFDQARFKDAVKKLVLRHEAFRTSFEEYDGEVVQRIHDDVGFKSRYIKIDADAKIEKAIKEFIRPFDLSKAPYYE